MVAEGMGLTMPLKVRFRAKNVWGVLAWEELKRVLVSAYTTDDGFNDILMGGEMEKVGDVGR